MWYKDGLRFSCRECGNCCKNFTRNGKQVAFVYLTLEDFKKLAASAGDNLIMLSTGELVVKVKDGNCIFYKDGCTIYENRPTQCRTFPFWRENLVNRQTWEFLSYSCHGIGSGRLYSLEEITQKER